MPNNTAMKQPRGTKSRSQVRVAEGSGIPSHALNESILQSIEVGISNASLLTLNATPVQLVATPGLGKVLEFVRAVLIMDHGGTDFVGGALDVSYTNGAGTTVSDAVAAADFMQASADVIRVMQPLSADVTLTANAPLMLVADADPTTGDGVVRVKVIYRVHETGL